MSDSLQRLCSFPSPSLLLPFPSFLTFLLLFSLFPAGLYNIPFLYQYQIKLEFIVRKIFYLLNKICLHIVFLLQTPAPMALSCSNPSSLDRRLAQNSFFFTPVLMALSPLLLHCENFLPRTH